MKVIIPISKGTLWLRWKNIFSAVRHLWKTGHKRTSDYRFMDGKYHYSVCQECGEDLAIEKVEIFPSVEVSSFTVYREPRK
jgi:hypothetical protein